ncbi:carbohydrate ABC transporter permease [Alicyclobacillus fastidiosus]|uniref:Carbohydrate ABC transporter permease n=1 Tax=Alicyclobacillus fastidiosus TaxID=392011 RepID=A0ABY6ZF14_9BACL|nr:carbohydrate ABC transporter permease [Alicyclobacillus fastidiosus]WAH41439.1 carbohydrate ABC transporter permease [Alicyclobacillus fastidiosus]GMA63068.1 ABC transporter permease [Alicyclobacillus fastidiosus]
MAESKSYRVVRATVLLILVLFTLYPMWTLVTISISTPSEAGSVFRLIPKVINFHSYVGMWKTAPLLRYLINSLIVSGVSALASVPIAILTAYALTHYRLFGGKAFLRVVLSTQAFPGVFFLLPLFVLYVIIQNALGITLDGSYLGVILTYLTFALPFSIWMLTGYVESIPRDVEEAAVVDGARGFQAFIITTLRIALPGVTAVGVFSFMTGWGEVLFASVLTNSATRTLPIGLQLYENAQAGVIYWNQLMAASLTVSLPVVVGFLLLQRYFVRGLGAGAIK